MAHHAEIYVHLNQHAIRAQKLNIFFTYIHTYLRDMDPHRFYGGIHTTIQNFPDNSSDEDLSDDEHEVNKNLPALYIPESDESDWELEDNIPLSQMIPPSSRSARAEKPRWRDGFLEKGEHETAFTGDTTLPEEIRSLDTPVQFYKYLFTDEMFKYIEQETIRYSCEKRPEKIAHITAMELEQFVIICLYMSIVQLPSTRFYWNESLGYPKINSVMACNRFEEIKRFIHFNTNVPKGQPGHDPLHKITPFLDQTRQRLLNVPREEYMAVDEQIIPIKSRSSMRQYNPKKPHKWGYKKFVLSGSSGFSYDFELYTGAQGHVKLVTDLPKISTSSDGFNYKLFFDTSLPLLTYLAKKAILPLGTIKANWIPGYKVPAEKELKKRKRCNCGKTGDN
ncbi:piggyBac transposable element-derived protein 3-like [Eupeodes corollae]|uniref:piggyBac transposable element-derived protein 3-like n=1 Tax=Eupeodes corollae TaxID=290404 RepID=UPI0024926AF8|nr:piggyBac transposable element-derived protein 3-like [Eupeodes corollae]